MNGLRVGFDAQNTWVPCGNSVYTRNLVLALADLRPDLELHLFALNRRAARARASIGEAHNLRYRGCLLHPLTLGRHLQWLISRVNHTILRVEASKLDLFHCTNPAHFPMGAKRVVLTLHDLIALRDEQWTTEGSKRFYRKHIARIIDSAAAIITVSHYTKMELAKYFPAAAEKATVIHEAGNSVCRRTEPDPRVLEAYGIPSDRRFLLFVGQYQPRKNIPSMLRAFSMLESDLRKEFIFVLVGSKMKDYMFNDIVNEVEALKDSIEVKLLVNVPDEHLLHLYNAAYAFVYVPFCEGFGVPVLEAMSCGCPVITSSVSSLPEVAGDAALLVDPNDPDDIRAAMARLLRDEALRGDLSQKGLLRSREFSWRRTASETLAVYERVANEGRRR